MHTKHCDETFFIAMGLACFIYAVIGFGPGFVAAISEGLDTVPIRVHIHGLIMMGWLGLLVIQPIFIKNNSRSVHRKLGYLGISLLFIIYFYALAFSLNNIIKPVPPHIDTFLNSIFGLQFMFLIVAPVLAWLAITSLPDNQSHRRFILILSLLMIEAATARMSFLPGISGPSTNVFLLQLYPTTLLLPLAIFDFKRLGKLHRATFIGGGLLVTSRILGAVLWVSPEWSAQIHDLSGIISNIWSGFSD